MFLEAHFGEVELHMPDADDKMNQRGSGGEPENDHSDEEPTLLVGMDEANAVINLISMVCHFDRLCEKKKLRVDIYILDIFFFFLRLCLVQANHSENVLKPYWIWHFQLSVHLTNLSLLGYLS